MRGHEINMASSRPPPYSTLYAVRTLGTMDVEYTPTRRLRVNVAVVTESKLMKKRLRQSLE